MGIDLSDLKDRAKTSKITRIKKLQLGSVNTKVGVLAQVTYKFKVLPVGKDDC